MSPKAYKLYIDRIRASFPKLALEIKTNKELCELFGNIKHQGCIIQTKASYQRAACKWQDKRGFLVLLDGIQDTANLGSIIRSAEALGAKALFLTGKSAPLNARVERIAAGASMHLPIFRERNLGTLVSSLKKMGYWICASAEESQEKQDSHTQGKRKGPLWLKDYKQYGALPPADQIALVIGNEGKGIGKFVLHEASDFVLSIPLRGRLSALNAGVSAAILMDRILSQSSYEKLKT